MVTAETHQRDDLLLLSAPLDLPLLALLRGRLEVHWTQGADEDQCEQDQGRENMM